MAERRPGTMLPVRPSCAVSNGTGGTAMTAEDVAELLRTSPLFADLDAASLLALGRYGDEARFDTDGLLARDGWPADRFYVLLEGTVALEVHERDGNPMPIETLTVPDLIGWSWLMPPFRWHFDVRAVTPVRAIAIEAVALRVAMAVNPSFGYALLSRFARVLLQRLQATRLRLVAAPRR
jgi:CRP/FNR family cyclic AMP-dependent transcriptional regulator